MYTIQTNVSGTRSMEISEEHLKTIQKYALFQQLIDSNGIVDESVLEQAETECPFAYRIHDREL